MTFSYDNVYINETSTITGPYEKNGPLNHYFDKSYDDLYFGAKTWEQAETKLIEESVDILLDKINKTKDLINVHIGGDLSNQISSTNYAASYFSIPFLGIYNACASSCESLIIASTLIEKGFVKNAICTSSSHNNAAEKQFRYPVEYGGPKRKTTTFTTTGCASAYLSYDKKGIKIESSTIGKVVDSGTSDVYHMGAVMSKAAADTIKKHLKDLKRDINYYDLVLTGDLGIYGKEILKEYMDIEYGIELNNYDDTACMIFDREKQPVYAGGSGVSCAPLVTYSYIFEKMKKGKYKKVLLVATGALMSPTNVNQKQTIPAIAHAVSLEAI